MKSHSVQNISILIIAFGIALISLLSGCSPDPFSEPQNESTLPSTKILTDENTISVPQVEISTEEAFENLLLLNKKEQQPGEEYVYELIRFNPYHGEKAFLKIIIHLTHPF